MSGSSSYWTLIWSSGEPVPPLDENTHDDQGFIVYRSREAAEAAAQHQNELWGQAEDDDEHVIAVLLDRVGLRIVKGEVNDG